MSCVITHRLGEMKRDPTQEDLIALVAELDGDDADREHRDVAISDELGWTLVGFPDGAVVWQNVEERNSRHLLSVTRDKLIELMSQLAEGNRGMVESEAWLNGYPGLR